MTDQEDAWARAPLIGDLAAPHASLWLTSRGKIDSAANPNSRAQWENLFARDADHPYPRLDAVRALFEPMETYDD
jgi:hypothetical protein